MPRNGSLNGTESTKIVDWYSGTGNTMGLIGLSEYKQIWITHKPNLKLGTVNNDYQPNSQPKNSLAGSGLQNVILKHKLAIFEFFIQK